MMRSNRGITKQVLQDQVSPEEWLWAGTVSPFLWPSH
jgi:hypothetical protein